MSNFSHTFHIFKFIKKDTVFFSVCFSSSIMNVYRKNSLSNPILERMQSKKANSAFNPQAPVAQKDEVVFWRFQDEGVEFFLIGPHWPHPRFLMRIFWKIPIFALPAFIFQWVCISRLCFESDSLIAYSN